MPDVESWIGEGKYDSFFDFHRSLGFSKQRSDYGRIKQQLDKVPVLGFNSRYDINLIKNDLFAVIGTDNIKSHPDDDYKRVQFVWKHYGMKLIKDLLIWYNNWDVVPFIKAIKAQRELFKRFDLNMFADGVSLPGLSEKVMYQTCFDNLQYPSKKSSQAFRFPSKRMSGYESQDVEAKREFGMMLGHLDRLLNQQKYFCGLCYGPLSAETASAGRINNNLEHRRQRLD
ncbi:unnamed protein product [Phytophthora lilii]|uniref:Unnamed protein product n=1 Tax=Phytophthora lilii TaxID=2077276 RepID=A0A9W6XD03_9STRA|nr:unnamed protein product [Phytophthora lilii]